LGPSPQSAHARTSTLSQNRPSIEDITFSLHTRALHMPLLDRRERGASSAASIYISLVHMVIVHMVIVHCRICAATVAASVRPPLSHLCGHRCRICAEGWPHLCGHLAARTAQSDCSSDRSLPARVPCSCHPLS